MKLTLLTVLLIIIIIVKVDAQTFLNFTRTDGSVQYISKESIQKITFSSSNDVINILLFSGTIISENTANYLRFTYDNTGNGTPLPVEMTSFNASVKGNSIFLTWTTATEVNSIFFEIERRKDLEDNWKNIGVVRASGNSYSPKSYSFTDKGSDASLNYYRLKVVDNDGSFKFSNTISITKLSEVFEYGLQQNYPNPFNPSTIISYSIKEKGFVSLKIFDILGTEVAKIVNEEKLPGTYSTDFDASKLTSGIYIYKLSSGSYNKSFKMLFLK